MKLLNTQNQDVKSIDLGIVEAGTTKEYTYTLFNDTIADAIEIKIEIPNPEVAITSSPKELKANTRAPLILKWSPSLTLKKGLKTVFKLTGKELYK